MLGAGKTQAEALEAYLEPEAEDILQAMQYADWVVSDQVSFVPSGS